jgi:hypothetical protein
MRIILALTFISSMLAFTLILNAPQPKQVQWWQDNKPIADPCKYHGASTIVHNPDGSMVAYAWINGVYVKMWRRG